MNKGSPATAIMREYPEHLWKAWKFRRSPRHWWKALGSKLAQGDQQSLKLASEYLCEIATQHGIQTPDDWSLVSKKKVGVGVWKQFRLLGGLPAVLPLVFPTQSWETLVNLDDMKKIFKKKSWSGKKTQKNLNSTARRLLP